jgi:hypothetical protein
MRDIVQVNATIYSPSAGIISVGSKIEPLNPVETDGFLDQYGYMFDESILSDDVELWS